VIAIIRQSDEPKAALMQQRGVRGLCRRDPCP